jgi:Tol biopolymer transport system component
MSDDNPEGPSRASPEHFSVLLQSVLELTPADRDRWLDENSAGNVEFREQLRKLIRQAETVHVPVFHGQAPISTANEMSLRPGQRLGRYEVVELLGAGGMGSVYRALDPSLGREVAIKALAHAFRGDSESLRRFEREARVLATLNHPNIATIYGFEQLDGSPYLVLERVQGETLAQRLSRGRMRTEEALAVAVQIAAGLEEAHAKGVIHRDLKPSNVMLASDGRVKLVDFGLAKTAGPRPDASAEPITTVGVILGTARYMSPEQTMGEEIDARTDVWAFGCVLYEMLTARPAFKGGSVSEVLAAVLRDEPGWDALPADASPTVVRLLRRCLRRDPYRRLQHIGDARLELVEMEDEPPREVAGAERPKGMRSAYLLIVAVALISSIGAWLLLRSSPGVPTPRTTRLSLELPARMALGNEFSAPFAIAPAGSPLVLEAIEGDTQRLYIRELGDPTLRALSGTDGARQPFFSADGTWVAFFANRKLSKVPVGGGPVVQLADIGGNPRGAAWAPDGTIVVAPTQTSGLVRISDRGGKSTPLTTLDKARGESSHRWPEVLPGGQWILFTVGLEDASFDEATVEAVSINTGERRVVLAGAGFARYAPTGQLLFVRGGHLHAVGFDAKHLVVRGTPEVVLDAVHYDWRNGGSHLAVSASGVLLYGPGQPNSSEHYLAWVDRHGRFTRAVDTPRSFRDAKASPDGRRIAIAVGASTDSDLWIVEANGTLSRLSFALSPHRPTWTSDSSGVTVGAEKDGMWRLLTVAADGKKDPTVLLESSHRMYPNAWSPDGRYLIFQESRPETGWDLRILEVDASGRPVGAPRAFATTPFHESSAAISLDGRWVAYESDELDGVVQVYARSFPDGIHKVRASSGGARWPAWDSKGNLHYLQTGENTLRVVRTQEQNDQLIVGAEEPVWGGEIDAALRNRAVITVAGARYDLDRTGSRFLVLESAPTDPGPQLSQPIIVLGWPNSRTDGRIPGFTAAPEPTG